LNDIDVEASYEFAPGAKRGKVTASITITVTPFVSEFSVNRNRDPNIATFAKDANGVEYGISSGTQFNGQRPGATVAGVTFTADLRRDALFGTALYAHTVEDLTQGNPAVKLTNNDKYSLNYNLISFPVADSIAAANRPFYPVLAYPVNNNSRQTLYSVDSPGLGSPNFLGALDSMDVTFHGRLYLVWRYASDDSIVTLARVNWQSVLRASTVNNSLTIDANSVTSSSAMELTNADLHVNSWKDPLYNNLVNDANFWSKK
jgi:hypothetical protein